LAFGDQSPSPRRDDARCRQPRRPHPKLKRAAVVLPLLYATSSSVLDPIGIWFGVAAGVGIAGALVSVWEGIIIGRRRQAALTAAGSARDARA
jgi:hypothetical protein